MTRVPLEEVTAALALALDTTGKGRAASGSIAVSAGGARYAAGSVASQTHLLEIPSELAALVRAVHACDREIIEVTTLTSEPTVSPSPLVLKILADHAARTGRAILYTLYTKGGAEIFSAENARETLPSYVPSLSPLAPLTELPAAPVAKRDQAVAVEEELKRYALEGAVRNFPTTDGSTGYGAALLAGDAIYYGGQYSAPEHRLGVHAEIGALVNALMSGAQEITHIAIASPKFRTVPATPCGSCRQLLAELCALIGARPTIICCATESEGEAHTLEELLPLQWSNKA